MADTIFTSFKRDVVNGSIDLDTDTVKMLLTTSAYTPSAAQAKRSDVTNEVTGTGYVAGGVAVTGASVTISGTTAVWTFTSAVFANVTIAAWRYGILYKSRGGAATADELIKCVDFGADQAISAGTFTYTPAAGGELVFS